METSGNEENKPAGFPGLVKRKITTGGSSQAPSPAPSDGSSSPSGDGAPAAPQAQAIAGMTLKKRAPGSAPSTSTGGGSTGGYRPSGGYAGGAPRPATTVNRRMERFSRVMPTRDPGVRMNENIRVPEIRVIDEEGQVGVMSPREALEIARERGLDLIEIVPNAQPPVCKIIDFGKWKYEQQKRDKAQKKTQHQQLLKEVRFHPSTDTHDFEFKTRHAREFLLEGHKVKATVQFKGREVTYKQFGEGLLNKFLERLADISKIDQQISMMGKQMTVVISPTAKRKKEEIKMRPKLPKPGADVTAGGSEADLGEVEIEDVELDTSSVDREELERALLAETNADPSEADIDDDAEEMEISAELDVTADDDGVAIEGDASVAEGEEKDTDKV